MEARKCHHNDLIAHYLQYSQLIIESAGLALLKNSNTRLFPLGIVGYMEGLGTLNPKAFPGAWLFFRKAAILKVRSQGQISNTQNLLAM